MTDLSPSVTPPRLDAPPSPAPPPRPPATPTESVAAIYQLTDLLAGREEPANTWRIPDPVNSFVLAPDGETALLFAQDPMMPGPPPHLRHLPTGKSMQLTGPPAGDWFAFGGWAPDGRLMLIGKEVWVADIASREIWMADIPSRELRSIAKAELTWNAKPSPSGGQLALCLAAGLSWST